MQPPDGSYSATASAVDLKGVLDFLNITSTYVVANDKRAGMASALAAKYPSLIKMLRIAEYELPGFWVRECAGASTLLGSVR